jgi:alkylation response protein AidB-like acyl-CoA dehydrogenase
MGSSGELISTRPTNRHLSTGADGEHVRTADARVPFAFQQHMKMCGRVADCCVHFFGGAGYVTDYTQIERWFRDVRLFRLYEGTSRIHQLNIARLTPNQAQ